MSRFKRFLYVLGIACMLLGYSGCTKEVGYADMSNEQWIMEQVQSGKMTQAEADAYLEQLKKISEK